MDIVPRLQEILRTEASAISALVDLAQTQATVLEAVCQNIVARTGNGYRGRLVVCGVGKAGLIGRKLSATFASTGTPSLFLHPTEARHGDLGMVQDDDLVLVLSNSGASEEIVALLPNLQQIGCSLIAITGRLDSPLAQHADQALHIGELMEACPHGLAPSTTTTAMLALGDAIALTVQGLRSFSPEDYARFHPGGALGRKLMSCAEAMRPGQRLALVAPDTPVVDVLPAISKARAGSALLVGPDQELIGLFSDGDLRRAMARTSDPAAVLADPVCEHASCPCISIRGDELVGVALRLCAQKHLDELPVVDEAGRVVGLIDTQDLANRGFEP